MDPQQGQKQVAAKVTLLPVDEITALADLKAWPGWGTSAIDAFNSQTHCENCGHLVLWFNAMGPPTHQGWWEFAGKSASNGTQWIPHTPERCRARRKAPTQAQPLQSSHPTTPSQTQTPTRIETNKNADIQF